MQELSTQRKRADVISGENGPSHHWQQHARQWSLVKPPLRPCEADISIFRNWLSQSIHEPSSAEAVVLGVTPELCALGKTLRMKVVAVDNSPDMIRALWPDNVSPGSRAICGDWRDMPLPDRGTDVLMADGSFCLLSYPEDYDSVFAEAKRLLRPGGVFMVRCFTQLDLPESTEDVFTELRAGLIGNFHVLKWRLLMALQVNSATGIPVGRAWETLHHGYDDLAALARNFGWPIAEVRTIEAYRGVPTRYSFPTRAEFLSTARAAGFGATATIVPGYELGERCPSLLLRPCG